MVYRLILPDWARNQSKRSVLEGEFTEEQLAYYNSENYNIYMLPNYPSLYEKGTTVDGSHIDVFEWVYVDMDLKDGVFSSKEEFIATLSDLMPTRVVDSGNGVHAYWRVVDLDAMSFLKLQRRLLRHFKTDEAVAKVYQLMRVPGTWNTKEGGRPKLCSLLLDTGETYTCEQLDRALPSLTIEDQEYCEAHYGKTYNKQTKTLIDDRIPAKFHSLVKDSEEVRDIWAGRTDDRSKSDYRLGHILFASGFSRGEASSVLVNCPKALSRAPSHRAAYADSIIDKIWTFELTEDKDSLGLSSTVTEILAKKGNMLKGARFPCHEAIDNTEHGFRLGQVLGLVAGSGVGKTAVALNMFKWFVERNPEYDHFFIPLEQPAEEIADRWRTMCGSETRLHDKVHVISNYAPDGSFRHLSFDEIKEYILKHQRIKKKKIGCVVIDHIGALKKKGKNGENQDLMDICHQMKAFAVATNTFLVMQSQAPREKAGIGDLELSKDAAYGTVFFESYCDYLVTLWQPFKRCHSDKKCPTITAFKFCKIRHKNSDEDLIQEDVPYRLYFNPKNSSLNALTQDQEKNFSFWNQRCTNKRKEDRKTDLVTYSDAQWGTKDART